MPTLADIYSAINTAQRKGGDFIRNPGASLQQILGYANDRARNFNQLNDQALAELEQTGKLTGPAGHQLMQTMSEAYNPIGMTVWHGSPHVFERFDLGKIGTGEGSQMQGRGMYMAQAPEVAKQYASMAYRPGLRQGTAKGTEQGKLDAIIKLNANQLTDGDVNKLADIIKRKPGAFQNPQALLERIETYTDNNPTGHLYKVDLPDTHIRRMLDWDAPLKDQPYNVRNFAKKMGMDMNDLGGDLLAKVGKGEEGRQTLQQAGIPGVKYFDHKSSAKQEGTRNFVVFDPNHLKIIERTSQSPQ